MLEGREGVVHQLIVDLAGCSNGTAAAEETASGTAAAGSDANAGAGAGDLA